MPYRTPHSPATAATATVAEACAAAAVSIVQARRIVAPGEIDPEQVVTPGIFVKRLVRVEAPQQEEELNRAEAVYP